MPGKALSSCLSSRGWLCHPQFQGLCNGFPQKRGPSLAALSPLLGHESSPSPPRLGVQSLRDGAWCPFQFLITQGDSFSFIFLRGKI